MALFKTQGFYTPKFLRAHSRKKFVFGDNLIRSGKGGQAAIRDMPNAVGVATKARPDNAEGAFFSDRTLSLHLRPVLTDLQFVEELSRSNDIVIPFTEDGHISLGLGLARLDVTSPTTYAVICAFCDSLAEELGGWKTL